MHITASEDPQRKKKNVFFSKKVNFLQDTLSLSRDSYLFAETIIHEELLGWRFSLFNELFDRACLQSVNELALAMPIEFIKFRDLARDEGTFHHNEEDGNEPLAAP